MPNFNIQRYYKPCNSYCRPKIPKIKINKTETTENIRGDHSSTTPYNWRLTVIHPLVVCSARSSIPYTGTYVYTHTYNLCGGSLKIMPTHRLYSIVYYQFSFSQLNCHGYRKRIFEILFTINNSTFLASGRFFKFFL